jgi:hypothetical protein
MKYRFFWENGVIQDKIRISSELYALYQLAILEDEDNSIEKFTGGQEWFIEDSPLDVATKTGILNCNGIYHCRVEILNEKL